MTSRALLTFIHSAAPVGQTPSLWCHPSHRDALTLPRNYHEFQQGLYDFSGRGNLTQFLELAAQAGLFVDLRIGPFICAGMYVLW
jgi:hypothetical protein